MSGAASLASGALAGRVEAERSVLALGGFEFLAEVGGVEFANVAQVDGPHAARAIAGTLADAFVDIDVNLVRALALLINKICHLNHYTYNRFRV